MTRKKVILFIVEGTSEELALGTLIESYYQDNHRVIMKVVRGDITTRDFVQHNNIVDTVGELVKEEIARSRIKKTDIVKVVHLIDTDGAFIKDDRIIEELLGQPFVTYELDCIRTDRKSAIQARNEQKSRNVIRLIGTSTLLSCIPYQIMYMSSNLDHVLYDIQNLPDKEKEDKAMEFAETYMDNIDGFVDFITKSDFSICSDYSASWKFIQKDCNSLKRYSNLGLLFSES